MRTCRYTKKTASQQADNRRFKVAVTLRYKLGCRLVENTISTASSKMVTPRKLINKSDEPCAMVRGTPGKLHSEELQGSLKKAVDLPDVQY